MTRTDDARDDRMFQIAEDLRITKTTRRAAGAGTWVCGTTMGHTFSALVFPAHAEYPNYELGESRISKLWIRRDSDKRTVVNFDRGWDIAGEQAE
jgi:hypothetical protein